jgi:hypothetical protein
MLMNVGLHPHVIGVPHRAGILRKFLAYAKEFDGVWWATREEIAAYYAIRNMPLTFPAASADDYLWNLMTAASAFAWSNVRSFRAGVHRGVIVAAIVVGIGLGGQVIARQVVSGLILGSIYMTVAVAFTLTIGVLNFLNFTIPTLFMLTGMVAWGLIEQRICQIRRQLGLARALVAGVAVAVLASLIVERFTFRYLKMKHGDATEHAIPLVSSLGFFSSSSILVLDFSRLRITALCRPIQSRCIHMAGWLSAELSWRAADFP